LCHVTRMLRELGIETNSNVPEGCQQLLDHICPVYEKILNG
jgi:hypothetical protein